jgi:glycine cleavage system H lipoate-binding protein
MPFSGSISEVNAALNDDPSQVNTDPYGKGWMVNVKSPNTTPARRTHEQPRATRSPLSSGTAEQLPGCRHAAGTLRHRTFV